MAAPSIPSIPSITFEPAAPVLGAARTRTLVATNGVPECDAALRVGRALAERDGTALELLTVFEPLPLYDAEIVPANFVAVELTLKRQLWDQVDAQRHRVDPEAARWPVTWAEGHVASGIAAAAGDAGDTMIVLGLGRHGALDRVAGRETALQVIRLARAPVLAVAPDAPGLPRRALAAVDRTESSVRAAAAALDLLGGAGTLVLAHATPRVTLPQQEQLTWDELRGHRTRALFAWLDAHLTVPPGVAVEHVMLHGDAAPELLAYAADQAIDLIAAGSHGRSALGRLVLGSVSTKLVRGAGCSVLVVPGVR